MAILADCHMHTFFSADSEELMENQIEAALAKGLHTICFTDHMDLDSPFPNCPDKDVFIVDYDEYRKKYLEMKELYGGRINLLFGIEIGLTCLIKDKVDAWLAAHTDFDYIIGSTHSVDGLDPYFDSYYEQYPELGGYRRYFETVLENVNSFDNYDSFGHLDFALRYGPFPADGSTPRQTAGWYYREYREIIDEALRVLIRKDKALEINTSALRKGFPETNPGRDILSRYRELGGELVTIGADAHFASAVAYGFDQAQAMLTSCGFNSYAVFTGRKPVLHPLLQH